MPLLIELGEVLCKPNPVETCPFSLIQEGICIYSSDSHIASHLEGDTKEANPVFA